MNYAPLLGVEPDEVVKPATVEEVAAVVARANASGKAVIPWGGGTGQDYGYLPRRADIVLDLSGLSRIVAHEPGDMTVTVEAGATLAQVQAAVVSHNQFLPLDPPYPDAATIGGILAVNASGAFRLGYGTARDWLIGLTVVDARGRVIKGGGKVVKNVTGYDLPKLHVGALGTLGVIVEATFKLAPLPETTRFSDVRVEPGRHADLLRRLHAETSPARSVLVSSPERGTRLQVEYEGTQEEADAAQDVFGRFVHDHGLESGNSIVSPFRGVTAPFCRVSGTPSEAQVRHDAIVALDHWSAVQTLFGAGNTDSELRADQDPGSVAARMIQWAREHQKAAAFLHAPARLRDGHTDLWWPLPPAFALMKRMKVTLDPDGTLNPGRFVGRL